VQANQGQSGPSIAITPENYKFKYKGMEDLNGRDTYVLRVTPREKKVGLFKGELWLDAETCMPIRESGSFVKTPSVFLKKVQFVRNYMLRNGVSVPQRTESKIEARFFGPVELEINYQNFSKETDADASTGTLNDPK
jgi:outer membrane lipoprotein-sorting protein